MAIVRVHNTYYHFIALVGGGPTGGRGPRNPGTSPVKTWSLAADNDCQTHRVPNLGKGAEEEKNRKNCALLTNPPRTPPIGSYPKIHPKLSTESSLNLSGASLGKSSGDGGDLLGDEF